VIAIESTPLFPPQPDSPARASDFRDYFMTDFASQVRIGDRSSLALVSCSDVAKAPATIRFVAAALA
jgi:hypothetical protein